MDIQAYLDRINYSGQLDVSLKTLSALQLAHLHAVPFENLSIHNDEPIILEEPLLFEKVIKRRRGGFCYELNGLFSSLLRHLGFQVDRLSANVGRDDGTFSADFDHMTLLVTLDERWLVDVGFGETFLQPLRLDSREIQPQDNGQYRIEQEGEHYTMIENRPRKNWAPGLRFTLQPYEYGDYVDRCHFQQYSPDSTFKKGRICSLATPTGRISLSELKFITTSFGGSRIERDLADEAEFSAVLIDQFGITLS